jgi:uncharacterized protein YprB with RNaseH-like and TPR domain
MWAILLEWSGGKRIYVDVEGFLVHFKTREKARRYAKENLHWSHLSSVQRLLGVKRPRVVHVDFMRLLP